MCDDRHHRGHHRSDCCDDGHGRGRGRPRRHHGEGRHHREEQPHSADCCGPRHQEHYFHHCDCSLEEKLIYLERMLAYKKADVEALEAILEVLKESLTEDGEEEE